MEQKNWQYLKILSLITITLLASFFTLTSNFLPKASQSRIETKSRRDSQNKWHSLPAAISATPLSTVIKNPTQKVSAFQQSSQVIQQGKEITLNGRKFPVAWSRWQQGTETRIGISDTGAMNSLGMELLSTNNSEIQPLLWFSSSPSKPLIFHTKLISPYRYLDITDFAQLAGWQLEITGSTLNIKASPAQVENIYQVSPGRIIVDLDRPTFWQLSQNNKEGAIKIAGIANSELVARFSPPPPVTEEEGEEQQETSPLPLTEKEPPPFIVESADSQTKLLIKFPSGNGLRIWSLTNPNRLIIDIRPDYLIERDILWFPGIRWRQQFISLNNSPSNSNSPFPEEDLFPVVWLEIDLRSPHISLKPITSNSDSLIGTAPLLTTARSLDVAAAINGGFFNRNNQLPLGAIRTNKRWLSGPILNRGAIAWNNSGQIKIGRLHLQETLTTSLNQHFPILFLNSGYVKAGLARYTTDWGDTYTPLTDNETIIFVQNNYITQQLPGGIAQENSFPIPEDGYLLTIRAEDIPPQNLARGTKVNLQSFTIPDEFAPYPHIIGAGPLLLQNHQNVLQGEAEKFSTAFNQQKASRSAIATTNQGNLIIATVHNRSGGRGPSLEELTQIMQRLGVTNALNLDGGSSTSLYLGGQLIDRSPVTAARVHNGIGIFIDN